MNIKDITTHLFKENNITKFVLVTLAGIIIFFFSNKEMLEDILFFNRIYYHISGALKIILISLALLINLFYIFLPIIKKDIEITSLKSTIEQLEDDKKTREEDLSKINGYISGKVREILLNIFNEYNLDNADRITLYAQMSAMQNGMVVIDRYSGNRHFSQYSSQKIYSDDKGVIGKVMESSFYTDFSSPCIKSTKGKKRDSETKLYLEYHAKNYNFTEDDINKLTSKMRPCRFVAKSIKDKNGYPFGILLIEGEKHDSLSHFNETLQSKFKKFSENDKMLSSILEIRKSLQKYNFVSEIQNQNANHPQI